MLVLTRRTRERIIIKVGKENIVITVVEIYNGRVRLGFEAPRKISVYREELWKNIKSYGKKTL